MRRLLLQTTFLGSSALHYSHRSSNFRSCLTDSALDKCVEKFSVIQGLKEWKHLKKKASVLIPLCLFEDKVCILYTLRTTNLRRHSGQISFPGGMCDNDESVVETAVRETEEEIGIPKSSIKIYGCGAPVGRLGVLITPVVGYVGSVIPSELKINEKEVQHAFALPLIKFCDPNNCHFTNFANKHTLPVFLIDGYRVWGVTAYLTHVFLQCLLENDYEFKLGA